MDVVGEGMRQQIKKEKWKVKKIGPSQKQFFMMQMWRNPIETRH